MGGGAGSGRTPSPGPAGGFGMTGGAGFGRVPSAGPSGGAQPNAGNAEDQKKFSFARYSLNHSDLVDYLFVSATFLYTHYSPASFHFFVPYDERGFAVLERFSKLFLQRKLVHFDDTGKQVVLTSPVLDMDYDMFLALPEDGRQMLFNKLERSL